MEVIFDRKKIFLPSIFFCVAFFVSVTAASSQSSSFQNPMHQNQPGATIANESQPSAVDELQAGTALTRKGLFREAIPHLLVARGQMPNDYAAAFNLSLCYVATVQYKAAIEILNNLRDSRNVADVQDLLAQAYIGNGQQKEALVALQKAAALAPQNEKLYSRVANACMEHEGYALGLHVIDIGLKNLPQSARLHYERAMFLVQLDELDQAKPEFESARQLAQESEIGYLAAAQEKLFEGEVPGAIRFAREGVAIGFDDPALLTVLGNALVRSGINPGQAEFDEARTAFEKAIAKQPHDPSSQIALGSLDLESGQLTEAIAHLEKARELEPAEPSVYANLAKAYRRNGNTKSEQEALSTLQTLNQQQADRISSAPGDRKAGYADHAVTNETAATNP